MGVRPRLGTAFRPALDAAASGDSSGFESLYRCYAGPLTAFATARGADDPEAIANDVMLKVFNHLSSFDGNEESFVSWIFWIARNQLIDAHRARSRRPQPAPGAPVPHGLGVAAETAALDRIGAEGALRWLETLTPDQRDVIALRMVADLSIDQVARVLGKPATAVKSLQKRGLRQLQKEISVQGVSR